MSIIALYEGEIDLVCQLVGIMIIIISVLFLDNKEDKSK